ncbi:hypothetical protein NDU88_003275 [Pleurodeles waltl]|uniref:Uncharacterized protein n=1 Tax=Pleurodeles waltl TaxID=8319 RepID=A0AAV7TP27_PLEWA|nr:hypothetical protein NDU88_003275 [Pleurodeles waltl]
MACCPPRESAARGRLPRPPPARHSEPQPAGLWRACGIVCFNNVGNGDFLPSLAPVASAERAAPAGLILRLPYPHSGENFQSSSKCAVCQ